MKTFFICYVYIRFSCVYIYFTTTVSSFDTSNVTNMEKMFFECIGLISLEVSKFNTSKVTKMDYMFNNCSGLTDLNLKNWNVNKVLYYNNIFSSVSSIIKIGVSNSTMRQWVIDKSFSPKLTTTNVVI